MNFKDILIHDPILACLISFLAPLDWMCLAKALPTITKKHFPYRKTLNKLTREGLLRNLTIYFANAEVAEFILENLGNHYSITGGFLLATITGEPHFMQGDLDVIHIIHKRNGPCLEDRLHERRWMKERIPITKRDDPMADKNLSVVIDYLVLGKLFQVLHVHRYRLYVQSVDFAFCKNCYKNIDGLYVHDFESIMNRHCRIDSENSQLRDIDLHYSAERVSERIMKYKKRGYKIYVGDDDLCALLVKMLEK